MCNRVAGLDDIDDLLGVAVDQRHLAGVTQRGREDVRDVVVVHLLFRPLVRRHDDLPGALHVGHAPLRRGRRVLLDVARHQVDLGLGELTRGLPVRHARRRAVGDEDLEVVGALVERDVRRQRLAGGALAQHAVAASAALEVDLPCLVELGLRHRRRLRVGRLVHRLVGQRRGTGLVFQLGLGDALLGRLRGQAGSGQQRRQRHEPQHLHHLLGLHGTSLVVDHNVEGNGARPRRVAGTASGTAVIARDAALHHRDGP